MPKGSSDMKMLHLSTFYDEYWKSFYARNSLLPLQEYKTQHLTLANDCFGWADFWCRACTPLGYEVEEIFANVKPLQLRWAQENGIHASKNWFLNIAFKQIQFYQPTILFIENCSSFPRTWIEEIRQVCDSIRLIVGWCGAPLSDLNIFNAFDLVLSCIPELVDTFRNMGHCCEHLNHAFAPHVLEAIDSSIDSEIDFSFIGQIVRSNQYHLQREKNLEALVKHVPIQIFCPNYQNTWQEDLKFITKSAASKVMNSLKRIGLPEQQLNKIPKVGKYATIEGEHLYAVSPQLQPFIKAPVFGLNMFRTLKKSKATFNSHIDLSSRSASNMRLFESTGVGTCLVTDWKENLHTLFELETEVVTYKSIDECIEKVKWLLEKPQTCLDIGLAGQKRTLKDHTFSHRAEQLNKLIMTRLNQ